MLEYIQLIIGMFLLFICGVMAGVLLLRWKLLNRVVLTFSDVFVFLFGMVTSVAMIIGELR